jgi:uncharacterized protein
MSLLIVISLAALGYGYLWRRGRFAFRPAAPRAHEELPEGTLETVFFPAIDGTLLEGWLIRPRGAARAPLVIMGPGLTGTKEGPLEPFARRFARAGIATLLIDYRCFGGSGGLPRHWVDLTRHREDYEAALAFARGELHARGLIDRDRIALWGTSFSGGTVLVAAARDANVAAVIAQCPFLDVSKEVEPRGLSMARYVFLSVLDMLPFLPPVYIPVFGKPGEWVFAPSSDNPSVHNFDQATGSAFWRALPSPLRGGWENRMLARMLSKIDEVRPITAVSALHMPVLFVAAERDDMIPLALVREAYAATAARDKALHAYPCSHFDLYLGPDSAAIREAHTAFLVEHLHVNQHGEHRAAVAG